jgi:hypothetical protein
MIKYIPRAILYISVANGTGMLVTFILFACPARSNTMLAEDDRKEEDPVNPSSNNDITLLNWETTNTMP